MASTTLRPATLARLRQLLAQAEGARQAAQAAIDVHEQLRGRLNEVLTTACADDGLILPTGESRDVSIDWDTGVVSVATSSPNGVAQEVAA